MIHHFVKQDLLEVCEQLKADGFDFNPEWLAPFFEFRFPLLGKIQQSEIQLEITQQVEYQDKLAVHNKTFSEKATTKNSHFICNLKKKVSKWILLFLGEKKFKKT